MLFRSHIILFAEWRSCRCGVSYAYANRWSEHEKQGKFIFHRISVKTDSRKVLSIIARNREGFAGLEPGAGINRYFDSYEFRKFKHDELDPIHQR